MEWKIGEIRQVNGEWYQCVESKQDACTDCAFNPINGIGYNCSGSCTYKQVIFKKLEKVGEPYYNYEKKLCQQYKCYINPLVTDEIVYVFADNRAVIEIKQTKEDMEEREWETEKIEQYPRGKRPKINKQEKLNLKPFNLEAAKAGKPVCTRDGRKARIICFDFRDADEICCIIAAVDYGEAEKIHYYDLYGKYRGGDSSEHDLMMLPEKKEGWVNLYKSSVRSTKEEAMKYRNKCNDYIDTIKIEWEE